MFIGFLIIYFIIALFSVAIITIFLEEDDNEDIICSNKKNTLYAIIYGAFLLITIITFIIIFY